MGKLRAYSWCAFLMLLVASISAGAQTFSVVYNFGSQANDPINPSSSGIITQGRDGNLYSSAAGGTNGLGAAYAVTPSGTLSEAYAFGTTLTDGINPDSGLTLGTDGDLYGTTVAGVDNASYGTVFKMTPRGGLSTLYTFTGGNDGAAPFAPPILGTDGNLYGTTYGDGLDYGSIYKITASGFNVLYTCGITDCYEPEAPLIQGSDGNFYGTSTHGGVNGEGSIFEITPAGNLSVLYSFDGLHGAGPIGPLVEGADGNFYGTTVSDNKAGHGVVFAVTRKGKLAALHYMNYAPDGAYPSAGLIQATDGNFYGANTSGGDNGYGTIFKVAPKGSAFVFSVLHSFGQTDGEAPYTTLFQHTNGQLYGTTQLGGTGDVDIHCSAGFCGVLYSEDIGAAPLASLVSRTGKVGAKIGILGQDFNRSSVVTFGTVAATTVTLTGSTFLVATVPGGATTGSVTVTATGGTLTSSKTFLVTPQIKSFAPPSGPVGTTVTITGVSLTQTTKVTFGGVAATFIVNSDTQITATVPTGAKTGKIAIITPGGAALSSSSFTVTT